MIRIEKIYYLNSHATVKFAAEELERLLKKAGQLPEVINGAVPEVPGRAVLLDVDNEDGEGFVIVQEKEAVRITGKNPRSLLYGVYRFCERIYGFRWPAAGEETTVEQKEQLPPEGISEEPLLRRRGNIIETINDPGYIKELVDWGVKNGLNEFFFTFFLWDSVKNEIEAELLRRDVNVTLGGHSLRYLVKEAAGAEAANESVRFFSGNYELQDRVISRIVDQCRAEPVIRRISLWPEDIGVNEREYADFLPVYIAFMERLQTRLLEENLSIEVEHIVYNAGLAWNMLERNGCRASSELDVLYAYWGRDYSERIDGGREGEKRAALALKDWVSEAKKYRTSVTVLEYYSDHFMLSELFPPLFERILQDVQDYRNTGARGLLNLIVPLHIREPGSELAREYPWRKIHQLNNYFYAGACWGRSREELCCEFETVYHSGWLNLFLGMEKIIARQTRWNTNLFPARIVDTGKIDDGSIGGEDIVVLLEEISRFIDKAAVPAKGEDWLFAYLHHLKETADTVRKSWEKKGAVQ